MKKTLTLFFLCCTMICAANTRYVDSAAAGTNNGLTWANAFTSLQSAIQAVQTDVTIDSILIAKGTYYPSANPTTSISNRDRTFFINRKSLKILGGYATGGASRNIALYPTVLSGNIGSPTDSLDNVHHVMVIGSPYAPANYVDSSLVIEGLTFTRAVGNLNSTVTINPEFGPAYQNHGGGILIGDASPLISKCTFYRNMATNGAGIYLGGYTHTTQTIIRACSFVENRSTDGAGLYLERDEAVVSNCVFNANFSNGSAYGKNSNAIFSGCTFEANDGGSTLFFDGMRPSILDCNVTGNQSVNLAAIRLTNTATKIRNCNISGNYGSGIWVSSSNDGTKVYNCKISGNQTNGFGAGIITASEILVANCLITGNVANTHGGGVYISNKGARFINTTIAGNSAPQGGAMSLYTGSSTDSATFVNCIIYGNSSGIYFASGGGSSYGRPRMSYTTMQGGYAGVGNSTADPLFVNAPSYTAAPFPDGDYNLQPGSPAVNSGNTPMVFPDMAADLAGRYRITQTVDRGAYESGSPVANCSGAVIYVDSSVAGGDGSSWSTAYSSLSTAILKAHLCPDIDSILVAKGTYYPENVSGFSKLSNKLDKAFTFVRKNLALVGGYPTGGGSRDPVVNPVVLSGENDSLDNNNDNLIHIMVIAGDKLAPIDTTLIIDGFTFTKGGSAYAPPIYGPDEMNIGNQWIKNTFGTAMYNSQASPYITNCRFTGNVGDSIGSLYLKASVVYNTDSSSAYFNACTFDSNFYYYPVHYTQSDKPGRINNCMFVNNSGSLITEASVKMTNCTITGNPSSHFGGNGPLLNLMYGAKNNLIDNCIFTGNTAISMIRLNGYSTAANPVTTLINSTFTGNTGTSVTGDYATRLVVNKCLFTGNSAYSYGGALWLRDSVVVDNCKFLGNTTDGKGGAIYVNANGRIVNCLFAGNTANEGGAIYFEGGTPNLINATISGNKANLGGAIYNNSASPSLRNCIVYGNSSGMYSIGSGTPVVTNTTIQGGYFGTGNLTSDPLFTTAPSYTTAPFTTGGNYYLLSGSPAINSGNNTYVPADITKDLAGANRIMDMVVERGALEFNGTPLPLPLDIYARNQGATNIVEWNLTNDQDVTWFEVERSHDSKTFQKIGVTPSLGKGGLATYSFMDAQPLNGINYYRIKLLGKDGSVAGSKIVSAVMHQDDFVFKAFPNPAQDQVWISLSGNIQEDAALVLYDAVGNYVGQYKAGKGRVAISMQHLPSGVYLLKYIDSFRSETIRLVKQ